MQITFDKINEDLKFEYSVSFQNKFEEKDFFKYLLSSLEEFVLNEQEKEQEENVLVAINIINSRLSKLNKKPGGLPDPKIIKLSETPYKTLGPILVELGKFKSISEARRNGWDRPLIEGSEFKMGNPCVHTYVKVVK